MFELITFSSSTAFPFARANHGSFPSFFSAYHGRVPKHVTRICSQCVRPHQRSTVLPRHPIPSVAPRSPSSQVCLPPGGCLVGPWSPSSPCQAPLSPTLGPLVLGSCFLFQLCDACVCAKRVRCDLRKQAPERCSSENCHLKPSVPQLNGRSGWERKSPFLGVSKLCLTGEPARRPRLEFSAVIFSPLSGC